MNMNDGDPTPDIQAIATAIRAAGDPMRGTGGGWDLVAKHHAEEISNGLRDAGETIAGEIDNASARLAERLQTFNETFNDGQPGNVTDGLFAIALALERIAEVMERKS